MLDVVITYTSVVLRWESFCLSEDIWLCLEALLNFMTRGKGSYHRLVGSGQGFC